jgi:hypothetical protein
VDQIGQVICHPLRVAVVLALVQMVTHPIELGFIVPEAALAPGRIRCLAS